MKSLLLILTMLTAETPPPAVDGLEESPVGVYILLTAQDVENVPFGWKVSPAMIQQDQIEGRKRLIVCSSIPATVSVLLLYVIDQEVLWVEHTIKFGDGGPTPDPTPSPDPPGPDPPDSPIRQVLILYESKEGEKGGLTTEQSSILSSVPFRQYLDKHGKEVFRAIDKDGKPKNLPSQWKVLFEKTLPQAKLPWIVVVTDEGVYGSSLPENVGKTIELLQKYGGK